MAKKLPGKTKKKKCSLSSILVAMKPTDEELEFRKTKLNEKDIVEKSICFFKCTKCRKSYKNAINDGLKISQHPFLGVLMCEACCDFYGDGNFSLASDDEDKYCRWCGEGGMLFSCSKCIHGFCFKCVKKHFGNDCFKKIEKDDNWLCFFCNPKPLWDLRFYSSLAEQVSEVSENSLTSENFRTKLKESTPSSTSNMQNEKIQSPFVENKEAVVNVKKKHLRKKILKRKNSSSTSDESDIEEIKMKKKVPKFCSTPSEKKANENSHLSTVIFQVKEKLEKVLKLTKYQFVLGMNWSTKSLTKLTDSDKVTSSDLIQECNSTKSYLSTLSSNLMTFYNTIDSIEGMLTKEETASKSNQGSLNPQADLSSYPTVLNFLNFVTNQVKMFMEKGITFEDLMDSEVYDSDHVLGIKKKIKRLPEKPITVTQGNIAMGNNTTDTKENTTDSSATDLSEAEEKKISKTGPGKLDAEEVSNHKDSVMEILAILENA